MRSSGGIGSSRGLQLGHHVCWGYDHPDEFFPAALTFLRDGVRQGDQLLVVGTGSADDLRDRLLAAGDADGVVAAARIVSVHDGYRSAWRDEPHEQVRGYEQAVRAAQAAGYGGLRVAADVTDLVVDAQDRDRFIRYEHLIDRSVAAGLAFTALCCYDRNRLGRAAFNELAAVHPLSHGATSGGSMHASPERGLELVGELELLDDTDAAVWSSTFERVIDLTEDGTVPVDAAGLRFIGHRALVDLDLAARGLDRTIDLRNASGPVRRLAGLLDLEAVRLPC